jgi:hypothetical protein
MNFYRGECRALNTNNNKSHTTIESTVDSEVDDSCDKKQQKLVVEIIFKSHLEKTRTETWK